MMRKLFTLMVLGTAILTAKSQGLEFPDGKNKKFVISHAGMTDCHLPMVNKSGSTGYIVYEKVSIDFPSSWSMSWCDNVNCFANFVDLDTFDGIANNAETEFKMSVFPSGFADTALVKYSVYLAGNPTQRDTITMEVCVQFGASTANFPEYRFGVYPNPVTSALNVNALENGVLQIVDLNGAIVREQELTAGLTRLDVADLRTGLYMVRFASAQGVKTSTFHRL